METTFNTTTVNPLIPENKIVQQTISSRMHAVGSHLMRKFNPDIIKDEVQRVTNSSGEFIWVIHSHTTMAFCRSRYKTIEDQKFANQWLEAMLFSSHIKGIIIGFVEFGVMKEATADEALAEFRSWK